MPQQTAVEWLLGFIEPSLTAEQKHFFSTVIEQAKAMEKKKMEDAWEDGNDSFTPRTFEEYYNENYKK